MRVAGIDPGTVSFGVHVLDAGESVLDVSLASADVARDPGLLLAALEPYSPLRLVLGPAGYGLPLVRAAELDEAQLALMALVRPDEAEADVGLGGFRRLVRALVASGLPLVFGPGVVHLPTVPAHRKFNRIDMGTADKVATAAHAIADQAARLRCDPAQTSFLLLDLGGAFAAALAVEDGRIVDGLGGSSGPIGARACGALDGEVAYLLGPALSKRTLFSGGALDPNGQGTAGRPLALDHAAADSRFASGWTALAEGAVKAALALSASVPSPREILLAGRLSSAATLREPLADRLGRIAPVRFLRARAAAHGAALIADGLAGGRHAPLVDALQLRAAHGSVLDHLRIAGAEQVRLG